MAGLVLRFATVSDQDIAWCLVRHGSVSPVSLGWVPLSLCCVLLGVAAGFWLLGAYPMSTFISLEIAVVGIAFAMYVRHATDGERFHCKGLALWWRGDSGQA